MGSLGEVATFIPIPGAFTSYAARLIDPSLGFSMGWIYWFNWASTFAVELTATGTIIQYWDPSLNIAIFIGVFWVFITALNFLPVSFYGELEFWFSTIKVATVIGFMIFAICIDRGVGDQGYLGFKYWHSPGAFATYLIDTPESVGKFVGFWAVFDPSRIFLSRYGTGRCRCGRNRKSSEDSSLRYPQDICSNPSLLRFDDVLHWACSSL